MNPGILKYLPWFLIGLCGVLAVQSALRAWFIAPRPPEAAMVTLFATVVIGMLGLWLRNQFRGIL